MKLMNMIAQKSYVTFIKINYKVSIEAALPWHYSGLKTAAFARDSLLSTDNLHSSERNSHSSVVSLGNPTIRRGPPLDGSRGQLQWVHLCVNIIEGLTPERVGDVCLNRGCPGDSAVEGCTTGGGEGGTVSTVVEGKRI